MTAYVRAKYDLMDKLGNELAESMKGMDLLHKTYVRRLWDCMISHCRMSDGW